MAALSAAEIRRRLNAPTDPLIVAPLLEPNEQLRDRQAAIDLRLGCRFQSAHATAEAVVDTLSDRQRPHMVLRYVPIGSSIVLHPHNLVLAETLEFVRLPSNIVGYVSGRSSWAREGLMVATAVGVHPSFAASITLEMRNLGELPIRLYPGDLICQLFLHDVLGTALPVSASEPSQFAVASAPNRGRHRYQQTEQKLLALKKKRTRG